MIDRDSPNRVSDVIRVSVGDVDVPRERIRKDLGELDDLAQSLNEYGLMHPIQVYASGRRFRLIAGERRLRAATALGWTHIEARVHAAPDLDLVLELVENTQRKHLSEQEEADALIELVRGRGYEVKQIAPRVGRSEAYVSKRVRVYEDAVLRKHLEAGVISVSLAEEFLAIPSARRGPAMARALDEHWDIPRARRELRNLLPAVDMPLGSAPALPALTSPSRAPAQATHAPATRLGKSGRRPPQDADPSSGASPNAKAFAHDVRALARSLRDVQPAQLTTADERALAELLRVLLTLARAHARGPRGGPVFPSIQEAERTANLAKRRTSRRSSGTA